MQLAYPLTQKNQLRSYKGTTASLEHRRLATIIGNGHFHLYMEGRRHELEGIAHEKKDGRHCPAALRSFEEVRRQTIIAFPSCPCLV